MQKSQKQTKENEISLSFHSQSEKHVLETFFEF